MNMHTELERSAPTALVIIDMQKAMQGPGLPARNNPQAEVNIARLLAAWRVAKQPIVHVRHMSRTPGSRFWPGQAGAEFQDVFVPQSGEHVIEKNVPDAFIQSGLERWLHVRGIRKLVVVGVSTNNSVESTARTGGNLGFDLTVVADACFAYEQKDFGGTLRSAEDVHLMALSNLNGEYARVVSLDVGLQLIGDGRSPRSV